MSLMLIAQFPELFKVAICDSPVTAWEIYDSGYTERYIGTPESQPAAYKQGNVLSHVKNFPDEHDRLYIRVGGLDENVHAIHTQQLVVELAKHNKPFHLQIYPDDRHGMSRLHNRRHGLNLFFHVILNRL